MKIILAVLLGLLPTMLKAQGENNIWTFSDGFIDLAIDFNGPSAHVSAVSLPPMGHTDFSSAVCYPSGQLRFIVNLAEYTPWGPPYFNIIAANGTPLIGSNLRCSVMSELAQPVVIPRPGNADQYYIFYPYSNGILYCLLDMSLNAGNGAVIEKDLVLAPYGTVITQKMVPVIGCDGVWLVARSRVLNGYYSFHVTADGVNTNAVVSNAGLFPEYDGMGFIKSSSNGKLLGLSCYHGLELYTFEKCSGKVKSLGIIDSTHNPLPYTQSFYHNNRFTGVGFSPDNSKLYATYNGNHPFITGLAADSGKLFQYDVSTLSLPAIISSKVLVLTNIRSIVGDLNACLANTPNPLGEIKAGPDGKLYIDNGSTTCRAPGTVPPGFNPGPGFHCLRYPNLSGLACSPELNVLDANLPTYYGGDFYRGGEGGLSFLQQEIVTVSSSPDTISGTVYPKFFCFKDTGILSANEAGECFVWQDGMGGRTRKISNNGTYTVQYFKDCHVTTDTYKVTIIPEPQIITRNSCPGMFKGQLIAKISDVPNQTFEFIWRSADGSILRHSTGVTSDTLSGIDAGTYQVTVQIAGSCDTVIDCIVGALPAPSVIANPASKRINYGDTITLFADGALMYVWSPGGSLDTATKQNPVARPLQPTVYQVIGFNEFGCTDTGYVKINIDYSMPSLIPNAFSPNGDGINDRFRIEGIKYQKGSVSIYNRYGQLVYHTEELMEGWDGNSKGIACDGGTYFYLINLHNPDGSSKVYRGDLVLLR